jgi:hypothetical protein
MTVIKYLLIALFFPAFMQAQNAISFGFRQANNVPVLPLNQNNPFEFGWAGGLNAPQFQELDVNNDNLLDLIVFDRTGDKLLTFRKNPGTFNYTYEPEWESLFPPIKNWLIIRDFNSDGKPDLFVSVGNGIGIYKNISPTGGLPEFELFTELLLSNYGNGDFNLYVGPTALPAIDDIDGDGDLDILTFYILGTCVEYHKNLSIETQGNTDTLIYALETSNWGNFTESDIDNSINLNDSCGGRSSTRHSSGSSFLLHDFDHDSDKDLFLGHISYPELLVLVNEPQSSVDKIISYPESYPDYSALSVPIFPGAFLVHADDDQLPDLVVAPNTDVNSLNTGALANVFISPDNDFDFTSAPTPFISDRILDFGRGAYPVFSDIDQDGDQDIIVGNFGIFIPNEDPVLDGNYIASLAYLENTGSATMPSYQVKTLDLGGLYSQEYRHLAPAAADLNGDSYPDLIVGDLQGNLIYLTQNPTNQTFTVSNNQIAASLTYATPTLKDLNNDNKPDLLVGGRPGRFQYFQNTGTLTNPQFTLATSNFDDLETIQEGISNFGYSCPAFINHNDSTFLFSGSESGRLFSWLVDPQGANSSITPLDSNLQFINVGIWTAPALANLNGDNFPEMVVGNRRGGLNLFVGDLPLSSQSNLDASVEELSAYPNPGNNFIQLEYPKDIFPKSVSLIDITGRTVFTSSLANNWVHLSSSIPSGIYFIQLTDKQNKSYFTKWIKLN